MVSFLVLFVRETPQITSSPPKAQRIISLVKRDLMQKKRDSFFICLYMYFLEKSDPCERDLLLSFIPRARLLPLRSVVARDSTYLAMTYYLLTIFEDMWKIIFQIFDSFIIQRALWADVTFQLLAGPFKLNSRQSLVGFQVFLARGILVLNLGPTVMHIFFYS